MPPENLSSGYMAYYTKGTSRKQWNNNSNVMSLFRSMDKFAWSKQQEFFLYSLIPTFIRFLMQTKPLAKLTLMTLNLTSLPMSI